MDTGLRLRAQPQAYWAGNYDYILQEGTPFLRALYTWHPLAAVAGYALWAAIIAGLLVLLPECLAVILSLAIAFGHVGGVHTWLVPDKRGSAYPLCLYLPCPTEPAEANCVLWPAFFLPIPFPQRLHSPWRLPPLHP